MNLFAKEKELIFKIVNGILLIWFVAAIVFTASSIIDLVIADPYVDPYNSGADVYQIKSLLGSVANIIIVGVALFVINKSPKKTDENKEIK
ncbi:MAG: hypothetical protein PHQ32_04160 [Firmicutes bacterium]|nr:hypothetical protein [Bacillota bacterium]